MDLTSSPLPMPGDEIVAIPTSCSFNLALCDCKGGNETPSTTRYHGLIQRPSIQPKGKTAATVVTPAPPPLAGARRLAARRALPLPCLPQQGQHPLGQLVGLR